MMHLNGSITLKDPCLEDADLFLGKDGHEFIAKIRKAKESKTQNFDIWVNFEKDKEVKITNTYSSNGMVIEGDIYIEIESKNSESLGFSVSAEQAKTIRDILDRYLNAYQLVRALQEKKIVKAESV